MQEALELIGHSACEQRSKPFDGVLSQRLHLLDPLGLTVRSPNADTQELISFKHVKRAHLRVANGLGFVPNPIHAFGRRTLLLFFFFGDLRFLVAVAFLPTFLLAFPFVAAGTTESLFPKLPDVFCAGV